MKRFIKTLFLPLKFVFLILLPHSVKMQKDDEFCRLEDSTNVAVPIRSLHKGIVISFLSLSRGYFYYFL